MDEDDVVLPSNLYECEECRIYFAVQNSIRHRAGDMACPVCKSAEFLINHEESAIVMMKVSFVQLLLGEHPEQKQEKLAKKKKKK